ncbi:unnamed protein product [Orchesella dallaii]|uniref:Kinesin motor domain-containing protein n=1 Tax=Orchesella dallaii TaxID=48710 RepID=A0ABP1QTB7_9HEXA
MAPVRMRDIYLPSKRVAARTPPLQQTQKTGGIQRRPLIARSARRSMMATSAQVDVLQKVRRILDKGKVSESESQSVAQVETKRLDSKLSVVVRVRPLNTREMTSHAREIVLPVTRQVLLFDPPRPATTTFFKNKPLKDHGNSNAKPKNSTFGFDRVYFNLDSNELIYNDVMKPLVGTLLQGYNCSVFAYGSTGSGKTYTMLGGQDSPGLTVLTLRDLYQQLDASKNDYQSEIIVSYLEVYNEQISDLLKKSSGSLQIRDAGRGNEAVIVNLSEHRPATVEALLQLLQAGNGNRTQHATDLNAESSRSHAVLQVRISMRDKHTSMDTVSRKAKLVMVDLAGSEKGSATGFTGERFREGTNINKSLLSLANCISALSGGKACASFRDSKLTRILKDSLSGNCRTVMVANVSPADTMKEDTLNTLKYASQAKKITLQASQNTMTVQTCLSNFTRVVEEMTGKIEQLQEEHETKNALTETLKQEVVTRDELIESQQAELDAKDVMIRELQEQLRTQGKRIDFSRTELRTGDSGKSSISSSPTNVPSTSPSCSSVNKGAISSTETVLPTNPGLANLFQKLSDFRSHVSEISKSHVGKLVNLKKKLLDIQMKVTRTDTFIELHQLTGDQRYNTAADKNMNKVNSAYGLLKMYVDEVTKLEDSVLRVASSEKSWFDHVAEPNQTFQLRSVELRHLIQDEFQSTIRHEQSINGLLWLQSQMMKKIDSHEEMLKEAFLVINELKNYLRHKELNINEASPGFKKLYDSFCGSLSVRFATDNVLEEGETLDEMTLDVEIGSLFTPYEHDLLDQCAGIDVEDGEAIPMNDQLKEEDDSSDDEIQFVEEIINRPPVIKMSPALALGTLSKNKRVPKNLENLGLNCTVTVASSDKVGNPPVDGTMGEVTRNSQNQSVSLVSGEVKFDGKSPTVRKATGSDVKTMMINNVPKSGEVNNIDPSAAGHMDMVQPNLPVDEDTNDVALSRSQSIELFPDPSHPPTPTTSPGNSKNTVITSCHILETTEVRSGSIITASIAASADPLRFYGLEAPRDEIQVAAIPVEPGNISPDEEMVGSYENYTTPFHFPIVASNPDELTQPLVTAESADDPDCLNRNAWDPLSQVLKPNTNDNADVTFVSSAKNEDVVPGSTKLESTYVKDTADTVENLVPPTSVKLPNISELVEKIASNPSAMANPKRVVKSGIQCRGKPEATVTHLKRGSTPGHSPPKRFRTGGFQSQVPTTIPQKSSSVSIGSAPRNAVWKKTPTGNIPTPRSIPSKKGVGIMGPPKSTN